MRFLVVCAALASARSATASTCDSVHAAKIAVDSGLASCTLATITPLNQRPSSGGLLDSRAANACLGLSANDCATYFRLRPELGLVTNTRTPGAYTAYHFGGEQQLQLPDGTRPMLYYKPAPGTPTTNPHFNKWIVFLYVGAGMCSQDVIQREGADSGGTSTLASQGGDCFAKLDYANQSEQKAGTGFSRDRYADFSTAGILGDHPDNKLFSQYNRVVITKSNDFYIGDTTKTDIEVAKGITVSTMQLQGNAIVKAAFGFFTTPVQAGADFNGASHVLIVASSSGTNSVHRVDEWRAAILQHAPGAYVGYMANSSGVTPDSFTLEEIDAQPCGSVYRGNCGASYNEPPYGETPPTGLLTKDATPRTLRFSNATFLDYVETYWGGGGLQVAPGMEAHNLASVSDAPNSVLDKSCLADEPVATQWKCRSPLYVMFNHLRTPLFIAHSLRDKSNIKGVIKGITSRDAAGNLPRWNTVAWPAGHPRFGEEPMATLGRFQFSSWVDDRDGLGGAAGDSRNAGPIGAWATNCDQHEPEKSDLTFVSGQIMVGLPANNAGAQTLEAAVANWFEARVTTVRIDGYGDSDTVYGSSAPPTGCE